MSTQYNRKRHRHRKALGYPNVGAESVGPVVAGIWPRRFGLRRRAKRECSKEQLAARRAEWKAKRAPLTSTPEEAAHA